MNRCVTTNLRSTTDQKCAADRFIGPREWIRSRICEDVGGVSGEKKIGLGWNSVNAYKMVVATPWL